MKTLFFFIILMTAHVPQTQYLSEIAGNWEGYIEVSGQQLGIQFVFSYSDGELDGTLDIPEQMASNLPVEFMRADMDSLIFQFETGTGPALFKGKWNSEEAQIAGLFEQAGMAFPFKINKLIRNSGDNFNLPEKNIQIPIRSGHAGGSLILTERPSPLIILLTGSGSQNRNENVAGFRVFAKMAEHLYDSGFSSFRYDDRGVGESSGQIDATINDLADDLIDISEHLRENFAGSFTEIILLGHSQGGLVASIAASMDEIGGIIYMGSPFIRGDKVINQQIRIISEAQGIDEEVVEMNLEFQKRIYDVVRSNGDWSEIEKDLAERLQSQINELPEDKREALGDMNSFIRSQINRQLAGAKTDWFKSFIEFDPAGTVSGLEVPMLAIFGEKDSQIIKAPNLEAAQNLIDESGISLTIVTIPEANHLFQKATTGMPGEYGMLEREFIDGFVESIVEWLNSLEL
jgi:pimeloyl-ACP methyl ester carboxylesterase